MINSEVKLRKPPIIILEMERSGASLAADLVHSWGAYGGDPVQLSRGDEGNLHGYWENYLMGQFLHLFHSVTNSGIPILLM
jgi:hypothetical protein